MYRLLTIIGARPQIIKSAAISRAIKSKYSDVFDEYILHTGQHYDENMSKVFFDELNVPKPNENLNVGSGSHAKQTGEMMKGIERTICENKFDAVILYGDTNSTIAGAIVAAKSGVPVVHIEAGLRSGDINMPEELNRIVTDHLSSLLFAPTETGYENLKKEGIRDDVRQPDFKNGKKRYAYHCGDIMYDNSLFYSDVAEERESEWFRGLNLEEGYTLVTVHRAENTDNKDRLSEIFEAIIELSEKRQVVLPLHPRTENAIKLNLSVDLQRRIYNSEGLKIMAPASFLQMTMLEKHAGMVVTDSGGVQKEAYFFKKPCLVLRDETEWVENVKAGVSELVGCDRSRIIDAYCRYQTASLSFPEIYGDGHAANFILETLKEYLK